MSRVHIYFIPNLKLFCAFRKRITESTICVNGSAERVLPATAKTDNLGDSCINYLAHQNHFLHLKKQGVVQRAKAYYFIPCSAEPSVQ